MKNNENKLSKKFPVREGSADSSIRNDKTAPENGKYPLPEEKDKQAASQPEFIEEQPNRKGTDSPAK